MQTLRFGTLDSPRERIDFRLGYVEPLVPDLSDTLAKWGAEQGHTDGWVYPERLDWKLFNVGPDGTEHEQPRPPGAPTPAVWHVPPTHTLHIDSVEDERRVLPLTVVNALGWALGNRVQFADWSIDGRVRWRCAQSFGLRGRWQIAHLLNRVCATAESLGPERGNLLALLVLHTRVPIYTWTWERHHWQYVALDACWRLLVAQGRVRTKPRVGHGDRIQKMCEALAIPRVPAAEQRIIDRRHDLAHEGVWCSGIPGYSDGDDANNDCFRMSRLVDRILLHILDIECGMRTRTWDFNSLNVETLDMREP